jgi:phosphoglycerate kinase
MSASASITVMPRLIGRRALGLSFAREFEAVGRVLANRTVVVLGGSAQQSTPLIEPSLRRCERLHLSGELLPVLLAAAGLPTGATSLDRAKLPWARTLLNQAHQKLQLPDDLRVRSRDSSETRVVGRGELGADDQIVGIGPHAIAQVLGGLGAGDTLLWHGAADLGGPAQSSAELLELAAESPAYTLAAGADLALWLTRFEGESPNRLDHVSVSGTAFAALLTGKKLPGVEALTGAQDE